MISIPLPLVAAKNSARDLRLSKWQRGFFPQSVRLILAISLVFPVIACRGPDKNTLADVEGKSITAAEVDTALGRPLSQLHEQIYKLQRQKLDELIDQQVLNLEAKRRGLTVGALLDQEVNAKILPVTDTEVAALYNANKERIPVELDEVRDQIRELLHNQRIEAQKALYIKSLRDKANVVIHLKPPPPFRAEILVTGQPFKGAEKAAVTIVKFEDFQCPFCKQIQPAFRELLSRYDGKVKLVHKDLPLDSIHPEARQAAEAARCAGEQGKFWEYHDKLYAIGPKFGIEVLKTVAKEVGLETDSFEACLTSGKFRAAVQKDVDEATRLGLTGTPAVFINGRELAGAQPLDAYMRIIDEELAQAK